MNRQTTRQPRGLRRLARWLGPALGLAGLFVTLGDHPAAGPMLGVAAWMALWWLTEAVPLAVTALLPVLTFPLAGIAGPRETAASYMSSIQFLFLGGFLLAQGLETSGLHRRIALGILHRMHASPLQLLVAFGLAAAALSMWISNTATTMLMVTIGLAVLDRLDAALDPGTLRRLAPALLLMIAYAANIGGMGTPVGTIPNLVLLENLRTFAPERVPGFLDWMRIGVPMVLLGLLVLVGVLGAGLRGLRWSTALGTGLDAEWRALGPLRREERVAAFVLALTALAWMTRTGIHGGGLTLPGWSALLPPGHRVDDGTVAVAGALLLFLLPAREDRTPLLGAEAIPRLPWDILLLLGGGFALAHGMKASGLSAWLGEQLAFLSGVPLPWMVFGVAFAITFLTEISSNTATTQIMLPLLGGLAGATGQPAPPLLLAATLAASCAFMLPVATPPNAIVFATHRIPAARMARTGLLLNLVLPVIITGLVLAIPLA
ncbi:MAG: SLC13/DASS family transporter [Gammaproteobacteria bacterium]|nr:MAG: SLC13/DASS family transporter [Gammaproteobacteria bacterium]